jgi:hypothetical protein
MVGKLVRRKKMFSKVNVLILITLAAFTISAQSKKGWSKDVTILASKANEKVSAEGDLAKGKIIEDLSWASTSSNACFPATQNLKYRGNHVFYATTIPPRSILRIKVIPKDTSANMSLYSYMIGGNSFDEFPDLTRCITCESDEKWDRPWRGKTQNHERKVEFQNPTQNTYNIFIGVAAPKDILTGKFTVEIDLES